MNNLWIKCSVLGCMIILFTRCDNFSPPPDIPQKKLSKDSMRDLTTMPETKKPKLLSLAQNTKENNIPKEFYKKISVSITENIPIRKVLQELVKKIGIDLQLDSSIKSPVFFQATERPFIEILEDICEMANLRYTIKNKRVRIENDAPYSHTYSVQFLNLTRNSQNRISVATNIFNNNSPAPTMDLTATTNVNAVAKNITSASSSTDSANGSDTQLNVQTNNDFWTELETNLILLLKSDGIKAGSNSAKSNNHHYSIHKQGGLLTVYATARTHKRIENYLDKLKLAASSQVLIEAKIIEVSLNNEFKSGINWSKVNNRRGLQLQGQFADMTQSSRFVDPSSPVQNLVSIGAVGSNFTGILQMLEEFGHARTLSSPRLTVMNNQAAVLKVAQNQVYFRLNYDKQNASNLTPGGASVSSTIQTVPIGLIMAVQPSINIETGEVILFLRPTISKFNKTVSDPAVPIAYNANTTNQNSDMKTPSSNVPVVEVREIDSVMKLQDGEIGILGGLMEVASYEDTNKIPGFGDVPVFGDMFSSKNRGDRVIELVILLKVSITQTNGGVDAADERLRKEYIADPRKWQ